VIYARVSGQTFALDLCNEKMQPDQWAARVAYVLISATLRRQSCSLGPDANLALVHRAGEGVHVAALYRARSGAAAFIVGIAFNLLNLPIIGLPLPRSLTGHSRPAQTPARSVAA